MKHLLLEYNVDICTPALARDGVGKQESVTAFGRNQLISVVKRVFPSDPDVPDSRLLY